MKLTLISGRKKFKLRKLDIYLLPLDFDLESDMKPVLTLRFTSGLCIQLVVFTCLDKSATDFDLFIDSALSIFRERSSKLELLSKELMLLESGLQFATVRTLSIGTISPWPIGQLK